MRPPSRGWTRELQVGMFVVTAMVIIAAFSFRITDSPIFRRGKTLSLYMKDATGIFKNSKVKMAGINIGVITKISLEEGRARIEVLIDHGIEIPKDAKIVPRPLGILGDKYLEVSIPEPEPEPDTRDSSSSSSSPGKREKHSRFILRFLLPEAYAQTTSSQGKRRDVYKEGEVIKTVDTATTLEDITKQLGSVSEDIKAVSSDIRKLVGGNKDKVGDAIDSIKRILDKIDSSLAGLDEKKFNQGLNDLSKSTQKLSKSFDRVDSITRKIDEGEGTIGKLINDSEAVDQLTRTLTTINAAVERANRTQFFVDIHGELAPIGSREKSVVGLELFPREDSAYMAALVVDESGTVEKKIKKERVNGGSETVTETETTKPYKYRISLQYFKSIHNLGFRLGLFESSGGLGLDYFAFRKKLKLSVEAFDFGRDNNNLQLRAYADWVFFHHFYLRLGGDDLASKYSSGSQRASYMLGLGLRFSDSDVKALLSIPGIP